MGRRGRRGWEGARRLTEPCCWRTTGLRRYLEEKHAPSKQGGRTQAGMASPQVPFPEATPRTNLATPLLMPVQEGLATSLKTEMLSVSFLVTLMSKRGST